jgi:hypothetical protein
MTKNTPQAFFSARQGFCTHQGLDHLRKGISPSDVDICSRERAVEGARGLATRNTHFQHVTLKSPSDRFGVDYAVDDLMRRLYTGATMPEPMVPSRHRSRKRCVSCRLAAVTLASLYRHLIAVTEFENARRWRSIASDGSSPSSININGRR